jgi:hypothetical protein
LAGIAFLAEKICCYPFSVRINNGRFTVKAIISPYNRENRQLQVVKEIIKAYLKDNALFGISDTL